LQSEADAEGRRLGEGREEEEVDLLLDLRWVQRFQRDLQSETCSACFAWHRFSIQKPQLTHRTVIIIAILALVLGLYFGLKNKP
jgi:hypothetical protein